MIFDLIGLALVLLADLVTSRPATPPTPPAIERAAEAAPLYTPDTPP